MCEHQSAGQIGTQVAVDLLNRKLFDRPEQTFASAMDKIIDSIFFNQSGQVIGDAVEIGKVSINGIEPVVGYPGFGMVAGQANHLAVMLQQATCDGKTDAGTRAGNQGGFVDKRLHYQRQGK